MTLPSLASKGTVLTSGGFTPEGGLAVVPRPAKGRNPYWCLMGGRRHHAYVHGNIGANIYWCPKHGFLVSMTGCFVTKEDLRAASKQIPPSRYEKFRKQAASSP